MSSNLSLQLSFYYFYYFPLVRLYHSRFLIQKVTKYKTRPKIVLKKSQFLLQNNARKGPVSEHSQKEYNISCY